MRRPLVFVAAWAAATVVAVAGSWVGLQPVLAAASPQLPARLSAAQLRDAAPVTSAPTATTGPSAEGLAPVPGAPSPPPPSPSRPPTPSPPPAPPSPAPPPPSPGPPFPELPASSEWEPQERRDTYERTFVLRGGEVEIRASPGRVEVISHTANPGYEYSVTRWSRTSVIVTFQSADESTSRLWVMWRNGPYAEITETI